MDAHRRACAKGIQRDTTTAHRADNMGQRNILRAPEFGKITAQLWSTLREESLKAIGHSGGRA